MEPLLRGSRWADTTAPSYTYSCNNFTGSMTLVLQDGKKVWQDWVTRFRRHSSREANTDSNPRRSVRNNEHNLNVMLDLCFHQLRYKGSNSKGLGSRLHFWKLFSRPDLNRLGFENLQCALADCCLGGRKGGRLISVTSTAGLCPLPMCSRDLRPNLKSCVLWRGRSVLHN